MVRLITLGETLGLSGFDNGVVLVDGPIGALLINDLDGGLDLKKTVVNKSSTNAGLLEFTLILVEDYDIVLIIEPITDRFTLEEIQRLVQVSAVENKIFIVERVFATWDKELANAAHMHVNSSMEVKRIRSGWGQKLEHVEVDYNKLEKSLSGMSYEQLANVAKLVNDKLKSR